MPLGIVIVKTTSRRLCQFSTEVSECIKMDFFVKMNIQALQNVYS